MKKILFFSLISLIVQTVFGQWQQTNGPYGGLITRIAVDGSNVYAINEFGLYRSGSNGNSWSYLYGLASTPSSNNINAVAAKDSNVFISIGGNIHLSTNFGSTWGLASTGLPPQGVISCFAINGTNIFAGNDDKGVYLSTNNGGNWTAVNSGLTNLHVFSLAISGSSIFAGTSNGIFLSINNGGSWSPITIGITITNVKSLSISGSDIYAGSDLGVYWSNNNGSSWTSIYNSIWSSVNQYALSTNGNQLFVGDYADGVITSSNNGNTWTTINTGLVSTRILCFGISGANLLSGSYAGIYKSTNNGMNWWESNWFLRNNSACVLQKNNNRIFARTDVGLYYSDNDGNYWTPSHLEPESGSCIPYTIICDSNTIYYMGQYRSYDNGASWNTFSQLLVPHRIGPNLLNIDHNVITMITDSGTVINTRMVGNLGNIINQLYTNDSIVLVNSLEGIFMSKDYGDTWVFADSGMTANIIYAIDFIGIHFYAATEQGIFASTDTGLSWHHQGLSTHAYFYLAVHGTDLFVANTSGVSISHNGGLTLQAINTGLPNLEVRSLVVNGHYLFAGIPNGSVCRLDLSTLITTEKEIEDAPFSTYPNPVSNILYLHSDLKENKNSSIKLFDINGKIILLKELTNSDIQIDMTDIKNGVYFLQFITKNNTFLKKVVVQK